MFNSFVDPQGAFFDDFSLNATSTAGVAGDYNNNGTVDAADYTTWRDNLGTGFALPNRNPANTGNVSAADYNFWVTRFNATSAVAAAAAVPEPMAVCLALLATIMGSSLRRGKR